MPQPDILGRTGLHYAAATDPVSDCVQYFLDEHTKATIGDNDNVTAIHLAACYGHRMALEWMLESVRGPDITKAAMAVDLMDRTPLHYAAYNGQTDVAESLMNTDGVSVDVRDKQGRSVADYAAFRGHAECLDAILQRDADPNTQDYETGRTPLMAAAANG